MEAVDTARVLTRNPRQVTDIPIDLTSLYTGLAW
jgi:hypothetical protein